MTFAFEETTTTRKLLWVGAAVVLLIAFMFVQTASAGGGEVAMEMIVVQAERQWVDVDGDGRLESFSADYTVYDDGTAEGVVYIDNEPVDIQRGDFGLTADGDVYVEASGVLRHEVGHTLGFRHEHTPPSAGTGCDLCGYDLIWDIDTAGTTQSLIIDSLLYYRD